MPDLSIIFVYIHPTNTQMKCSSVGIQEWDNIGTITVVPAAIHPPPTSMLDLDFSFKNNNAAFKHIYNYCISP